MFPLVKHLDAFYALREYWQSHLKRLPAARCGRRSSDTNRYRAVNTLRPTLWSEEIGFTA